MTLRFIREIWENIFARREPLPEMTREERDAFQDIIDMFKAYNPTQPKLKEDNK
jgi:hypothetical protein